MAEGDMVALLETLRRFGERSRLLINLSVRQESENAKMPSRRVQLCWQDLRNLASLSSPSVVSQAELREEDEYSGTDHQQAAGGAGSLERGG